MRGLTAFLVVVSCLAAQDRLKQAEELYQRTDYKKSIELLSAEHSPNAAASFQIGQDYFMLGEYKKAGEAFQKALALDPKKSDYALWLGRAWGRRAETSSPITAPIYALKARQCFEQAVALDPKNDEALNDLFDFYLEAPGFLGGGYSKAETLARSIAERDEAEGHFAQAQLADKRRQFDTAEDQLRWAMELAPHQVGRVLDLAKYLAKHDRYRESEAAFDKAEHIEPHNPKVYFVRAHTYVEEKRNLDQARSLLIKYLQSDLTPDDPPREQAEKLLRQVPGLNSAERY